jgi:putative intracellular protease/amidase
MTDKLRGKRFAVLATDGFEQSELIEPCEAIKQAGTIIDIVALKPGRSQGMVHHERRYGGGRSHDLSGDARCL